MDGPCAGDESVLSVADGFHGAMYNCKKCPGYCCSYPLIALDKRDVERLAKHFDLSFDEDRNRARKDHAAANLAVLRRIALSLLKQETSSKVGVRNRRLTAAWSTDYLHKVLFG